MFFSLHQEESLFLSLVTTFVHNACHSSTMSWLCLYKGFVNGQTTKQVERKLQIWERKGCLFKSMNEPLSRSKNGQRSGVQVEPYAVGMN